MGWIGWALAALGFMGLANLGMKAASLRGRQTGPTAGAARALGTGVFTAVALILLNDGFARGAKGAVAVGIMNANLGLVALLAFLPFREQLQSTRLVGWSSHPLQPLADGSLTREP